MTTITTKPLRIEIKPEVIKPEINLANFLYRQLHPTAKQVPRALSEDTNGQIPVQLPNDHELSWGPGRVMITHTEGPTLLEVQYHFIRNQQGLHIAMTVNHPNRYVAKAQTANYLGAALKWIEQLSSRN